VAVGSVFLIQGCGTTRRAEMPAEVPMPPESMVETKPVLQPPLPSGVPPAKSWPTETTVYVVKTGESLSGIAHRHNLSVAEIVALNGIKNADFIRSGHRLILPGRIDLKAPGRPKRERPPASAAEGGVYEVKSGDCLSAIAARYSTTTEALRKANRLSGDKIFVGQKLVLPSGGLEEGPTRGPATDPIEIPERSVDSAPIDVLPLGADRSSAESSVPKPGASLDTRQRQQVSAPPRRVEPPTPGTRKTVPTREHVVEENEDLYSVAMMWGVSVAELKELNGLTDTELKPGQRLKIPLSE